MFDKEKITKDTELDTWFGVTKDGQKVGITEVDLLEFTSILANSEDEQVAEVGKLLFEKAKSDFYIEMHDGTRLVKNIKSAFEHNMLEVAADLVQFAKDQNVRNGHLEIEP